MGSIFGNSTKTGVTAGGQTKYFNDPGQAAVAAARGTQAPTSIMTAPTSIDGTDGGVQTFDPAVTPTIKKQTFQEATTDKSGNATLGPGLTKRGALLGLFKAGLQGGMDSIEGGGLDAKPGQSSFGAGFSAAAQAPRRRLLEGLQEQRLQQEAAIQQQNMQNAPILFNQKVRETEAGIKKDNALSGYYDAGSQRKEQDQFKYVPGVGLVNVSTNQVTQKVDPKQLTPNSEAALRYAAAQGDTDAAAAVSSLDKSRATLKAVPPGKTGGTVDKSHVVDAASTFLSQAGGDPLKAQSLWNAYVDSNSGNADIVNAREAVLKNLKSRPKASSKPKMIFNNTAPAPAH